MKNYINTLFILLLASFAISSCTEEEGTEPGNDSAPSIRIYQYKPGEEYSEDNDVTIRFATNNLVDEVYYLAEKSEDKASRVSSMGEEGYMEYVITNGVKLEGVSGASNVDVTLTGMYGEYTITAVAVDGKAKTSSSIVFVGLDWADVATGTYYFEAVPDLQIQPAMVTLQVCTTDATLYRFKDLFGTGYHMKINMLSKMGNDAGGEYQYFRVPVTATPYSLSNYGEVSVQDIGYWQGNAAFVTDGGYESGMYADYSCFVYVAYCVSAGALGYGYDYFEVE